VSVLEPVLAVFQSYLGAPAGRRVGAQHVLDADYFRRIDALNFTMEHDDGQMLHDVDQADLVLVGISRTPKTPTGIYLLYVVKLVVFTVGGLLLISATLTGASIQNSLYSE